MKNDNPLVVKKVKYVEATVIIEENAVYKRVFSINPNGRIVINEYKKVLNGDPNAKTENLSTFEYTGDVKRIAKFIDKELEVINNAKCSLSIIDDRSGFIEISYEHDLAVVRFDRTISNGKRSVDEVFRQFFESGE